MHRRHREGDRHRTARLGFTVVVFCGDQLRGQAALEAVTAKGGNTKVRLLVADLSSQSAVRELAKDFDVTFEKMDVLVNNAGVFRTLCSVTVDGIEATFAVNHLAPFLPKRLDTAVGCLQSVQAGERAVHPTSLPDDSTTRASQRTAFPGVVHTDLVKSGSPLLGSLFSLANK